MHSIYFRHPDVIDCSVINRSTMEEAAQSYGLEMRLLAQVSGGDWQAIAGGEAVVGFTGLYLGDKSQCGFGFNTRYMLEVESNGTNEGADRPYWLSCRSGSGSTMAEMVLTGAPGVF